jgi:UDPglucose--hexose-1-phosphate uridylyltransferase
VAELRKDPLSGNWVVVGYNRTIVNNKGFCPFCPGNEHLTPPNIREIRDREGAWLSRCFPAANPVFVIEVDENKRAEGFYDKMGNLGAHEIIVESRNHEKTFSTFDPAEMSTALDMYVDRIIDLKNDKRFKYVQIFKNFGELAGSFNPHPHSHVLATPILPHRLSMELGNSINHYRQKERCLLCDVLSQETRQNKRIVMETDQFLAFCPFASRFPFEVWIVPRFHDPHFETSLHGDRKENLIDVFLYVMKRIEKMRDSYTIVVHTSPNVVKKGFVEEDLRVEDYFHWHIEILPRDAYSTRYKREDEFYTISVTPEETAKLLKTE